MENATKAILIAGGLLISIIVISIFYFMFGKAGNMVEEISPNTQQKEIKDFNRSFEAYNKRLMYGTDIISVINKAIDNNRSYNVEFGTYSSNLEYLDYYVDIEFTIYERDEYNHRLGKTNKKTYSLSKNYKSKEDIIYTYYLVNARKGDKAPDEFRTSFKFAGFKCVDIEYQDRKDVDQSNTGAIRKSKKNGI